INMQHFITPQWPAPTWIRAFTTTRRGGGNQAPYERFYLGAHSSRCTDNSPHVAIKRLILQQKINLTQTPLWLNQTHSKTVLQIDEKRLKEGQNAPEADGLWTTSLKMPCLVLTADCLPVLLCDTKGTVVAALHCGWRGILAGIIEEAVGIL